MASLGSSLLQTASTGTAFSTSHRPAQIASHSLRPLKARRASEFDGVLPDGEHATQQISDTHILSFPNKRMLPHFHF